MKSHSISSLGPGSAFLLVGAVLAVGVFVHCGGGESPTPPTSVTTTLAPTTTTTTAPAGIVLPPGMTCSPTPPPLYGMKITIQGGEPGRYILDSKPQVVNVDSYCQKVGSPGNDFCDTRPEGDLQRVACDYLAVGKASNGRWGPNWYWNDKLCAPVGGGENSDACTEHPDNQFLVRAKAKGKYEACASDLARVAPDASRCGIFENK